MKYKEDPIDNVIRVPKNKAELELYNLMIKDGFEVVRRGFPDYACFKDNKLILVEVKPNKDTYLKKSQYRLMKALSDKGIECCRWSPDSGFQPIY